MDPLCSTPAERQELLTSHPKYCKVFKYQILNSLRHFNNYIYF